MNQKLRIFLAEDEAIIRTSFKLIIEKMGHEVVGEAADGEQAVKAVAACQPDLILMDINIPKMDGLTALQKINEAEVTPCVIITGYFSPDLVEQANRAGAFGYLVKPIDENQLMAAVNIAMLRYAEFQRLTEEAAGLRAALEERKYIERAKGILMDRFCLKEKDAMRKLQQKCRNQNKKMITVAKEIIAADQIIGS